MAERDVADESAMDALGRALAAYLVPPAVVYLEGALGAGKTTLVRSVLRGWGHEGPVRSPTYTLLETYRLAPGEVHHLDLYRLGDPEEVEFLGIRDLEGPTALWLIEWAERGGDRLPGADYVVDIAFSGQGRKVSGLPQALAAPGVDLIQT